MHDDPDFPEPDVEYDALDFETRDLIDEQVSAEFYELVTGRPARPGTRRQTFTA